MRKNAKRLNWFQRFSLFFYDHRLVTLVIWLALAAFGVASYTTLLKREGFPNVSVPISLVNGTYFVNDQAKVDAEVTKPLSQVAKKVPGVKTVTSVANANFFSITVEYDEKESSTGGSAKVAKAVADAHIVPPSAKLEFLPINAGKINNQYDMLLAVYFPTDDNIDQAALENRARAVAAELGKHHAIKESKVIEQFKTGTNPQTGQPVTQQQGFDRIGVRQGDRFGYFPSVTIGIVGRQGYDAIHLYKEVNKAINATVAQPGFSDLRIVVSAAFAESITQQLDSLQKSLLEGLAVVLAVSFLLISWRAGLATALAMITVLLITITVLYATGNTLNTITLFSLILSLGLIVDDATIMAEAVDASRYTDKPKREIVAEAVRRVARASTAGTLVTMLAFAPMLFISGILGSFIKVMPITIIISLAVSLLVSLTLIPFLSRFIILNHGPRDGRNLNPVAFVERKLSDGLAAVVRLSKRHRKAGTAVGIIGILLAFSVVFTSGYYFQKLKFDIFPSTKDSNEILVNLQFTPGSAIDQVQSVSDRANEAIRNAVGTNLKRVAYAGSGNLTQATIVVDLVPFQDRALRSPEIIAAVHEALDKVPGAEATVAQADAGPPREAYPFHAQVVSEDAAKAYAAALELQKYLTNHSVTRQNGTTAHITKTQITGLEAVQRKDGRRYIAVSAAFDANDTSALVTATQQDVQKAFPPERIKKDFGLPGDALQFDFGNESNNQQSFKSMLIAFPVLLAAMYLLLAVQFRSLLQPLLIFMAIPFSFFGVAAGLHFTDNPLSFFVLVGFFALIGIAVNNTIMLVDYANQERDRGAGHIEAVARAVKARFRPLITTSLTSVVALVPLALTDPFWESLSFTLIFGLLSSTFLVVISFPYFYLAGETLRAFGSLIWRRRLWRPIQYVFDVVLFPIRLIAFMLYVGFKYRF